MSKNRELFRLTSVKALEGLRLRLSYADRARFVVDLKDWIGSTKALRALRDPARFSTAKLGAWGRTIEFGDGGIDLAGDNLRNLAIEQAGGVGHERIWNWMHSNDLTIDRAAEVLGISRRMLIYYRNGEKAIPRHIWLACVGWESLHKHGAAA
ncbi:MAG: DUF2442 domain-containing protein [Betaproteobacteria bacterium]|nr:DUF2442 domain-containing protein [Betaproteobacteria bacterium]